MRIRNPETESFYWGISWEEEQPEQKSICDPQKFPDAPSSGVGLGKKNTWELKTQETGLRQKSRR